MKNTRRAKSSRPRRWATYSMIFVCLGVLASGFFFAARQHFASMDFGMRNSRLRRQVDELEAEKRRLILARENSMSPVEIKKAAKKAGLTADRPAIVAQVASTTKDKAVPPVTSTTASKPMIVKTASVAAVQPTLNAALVRERVAKIPTKGAGN